jgi:MtrB/PioB family decaheme-associated outer membrane protein
VAPLGAPPFPEVALPPDNVSHQFYVNGGYNFTPLTRGMFKLARGRITQDESFPVPAVAGAPGNLGGRIDTTLAEAGLTTRPMQKLTLRANLRYENRDDKTPTFLYYPSQATAASTNNGENEPRDIKTKAAKLDGTYQLPMRFNLNAGMEYVKKERNSPPVRSVSYRAETNETTLSVGVRRAIGETATGSLSLLHSKRDGSDYLTNVRFGGAVYSNAIAPLHLADRDRNTVRATLNWMPTEPLSLNFRVDYSKDDYAGRTTTGFELGPRKGEAQLFSVDAAYSFSERLQATAWASRNVSRYENATCREGGTPLNCTPADPANPVWSDKLTNTDESFGLGLRAQATAQLKLGADFVQSEVTDEMLLFAIAPATTLPSLPNIKTTVRTLKLYGEYAVRKNTTVRVQWIHDQYKTDDWTWQNWIYSDGTTVTQDPNQTVNFLGAAVLLHF